MSTVRREREQARRLLQTCDAGRIAKLVSKIAADFEAVQKG